MTLVETIAFVCHQTNKSWCEANGDFSQKNWEEAEEWQRESAIKGVQFRIENPEAGDDAQHNAWMQEKLDHGWVYGKEKNAEEKTHPCIVPFNELPDFQQKKDALFCAIVDSLLGKKAELKNISDSLTHEELIDLREGKGSFGSAIKALKEGKRVARSGWNEAGMFAYYVPESSYPAQTEIAKKHFGENAMVPYRAYIALKTAQEDIATWSPSGSDALAEDWCVLEETQTEAPE